MLGLVMVSNLALAQNNDPKPNVERGAEVFLNRCSICHGDNGMGEGLIPLKIKDYPNTNLRINIKAKTRASVHAAIALGAKADNISDYMPPMGEELTWTGLESVVDFVMLLREDAESTMGLVANIKSNSSASIKEGLTTFETRCALCHGIGGEGDGRMAKVIKSPPPFDLTASRLPDFYLKDIISKGGEGMGRSKQMPPWGDQLTDAQIDSVIMYIKTLRD